VVDQGDAAAQVCIEVIYNEGEAVPQSRKMRCEGSTKQQGNATKGGFDPNKNRDSTPTQVSSLGS
jgi:hypothetical protein